MQGNIVPMQEMVLSTSRNVINQTFIGTME
jgi:hypothetical protein